MLHLSFQCLCALLCTVSLVNGKGHAQSQSFAVEHRFINSTALDACKALPQSRTHYAPSPQYLATLNRYIASTVQSPTCVFLPESPSEIADAMKMIAQERIEFAVSSGRHASNTGFSTTRGIQIDMKGFQAVELSSDKSYVDVGTGNIWDNVYQVLEGTGVNVVGGRVTGVGVGGFLAGGGGFSWKTNQYGLSTDTLLQADMVLPNGTLATASATENPNLFWAIQGGGNRLGIIYNWRLKTSAQSSKVYGGLRTYTEDQIPAILEAVADFSQNNTNPKAQVIPTFNTIAGIPGVSFLFFYDGPEPGNATDYFNSPRTNAKAFTDAWKQQSFADLVRGTPSNATSGTRGLFHTVSLQNYSLSILQQIANQSAYWGSRPLRSGTFISYDVEPFLKTWSTHARDAGNAAAWPHANSPLPLNIYFAWLSPTDDDFYKKAALESASVIVQQAKAEGQILDHMYLYPNYAFADTPADQTYGRDNAARLLKLRAIYDPFDTMGLTDYLPL